MTNYNYNRTEGSLAPKAGDKCAICKTLLIKKGDWIFCPKDSEKIPDSDVGYHEGYNLKTGKGWRTV